MSSGVHRELKKDIRLHHATAMVVGIIIGASIFVQPSEITGPVPSLPGAALVWLVAGILTFFGALVAAELASTFPESGGVYAYLREAFSPLVGFLWGWAMFWTMHTGIIAAIAMIFARYLAYFIPLGASGMKAAAVGAILFLSWVNYLGVKQGSNLQTAFTAAKVLAILLMIGVGFALGAPAERGAEVGSALAITLNGSGGAGLLGGASFQDFLLALVAGLFAFGGWHMVTYSAEETTEARRTIPRALTLGVLIVTVCYVALNAVYFYVLPLETVISSDRVAADAADAVVGHGGAFMSGLVVFSTFGAISGIILAGPRVYFAMARDGLLFKWVGAVHPTRRVPHRAIWLQCLWACILVLTGTYRVLFTRVVYTEWIFFGLMAVGLFVFRRRPGVNREYSVWGYPLVPAVLAISAFAIVVNQVIADPTESALGLGFVLLGVPVYYAWARRGYRKETSE
ncbi:MAG: amino acid permease [Longimicrobiales bacterium]|nr:amino acid permease [Longimicrobiales bacterium]